MKITDKQIIQIIKEELEAVLELRSNSFGSGIETDANFDSRKAEKQRPKEIKEVATRRAVDKFDSIISREYGLDISTIERMISKNKGVDFEGNNYYRVKDLAEALVEKEINSTDIKRLKFSDVKIIGPAVGIDMFKLIRPIIKSNRGFINKAFNFAKGKGFKQ